MFDPFPAMLPFRLNEACEAALRSAAARRPELFDASFAPELRQADPRHADFQANGAFAYAKQRKANPRALATQLTTAIAPESLQGLATVEVAGPGFINFRLTAAGLLEWLKTYTTGEALRAGATTPYWQGRRVVVDFSSPNIAKQMHVGHIRSTMLGEAVCRLLEFYGASTVRDNHIGDWGTPYGMLILAIREAGWDPANPGPDPLVELDRLYKRGSALTKENPAKLDEARALVARLQGGDAELLALWKQIHAISYAAFEELYARLGVRFDVVLGESFYQDKLEQVYTELTVLGLAEEDQGALVVFHDEHPRFSRTAEKPQPFLIRKSDGAANYATTDLATILHRAEHFGAAEVLYLVDKRQGDHFEQLFLTAQKWFERSGRPLPRLVHVSFGSINGEDNKPIKSRSGEAIKLRELLDEAVERSAALIAARNESLPEAERTPAAEQRALAERLGPQAVVYADLVQDRSSDYIFSWDKMLALDGNSAAYLLYAVARLHSIFRRAGLRPGEGEAAATPFETPGEIALARKLVAFPQALDRALGDYRPHVVATYLFELAGEFSTFYGADKVLVEDAAVRARRLLLCARTLLTLDTGLRLCCLSPVERM